MDKTFVIIGGDAAGMSAAAKIKRLRPEAEVIVFEKGPYISYAACGIPYWLAGVIPAKEKLQVLTPQIAREKRGVDVRIFHEVTSIDPRKRMVEVVNHSSGEKFQQSYDQLIIATGARPVKPPIPGVDLPGVYTLRSLADGEKLQEAIDTATDPKVLIVGAGYIGLELVETFVARGFKVTLVELTPQVLPNFDADFVQPVEKLLRDRGVTVLLNTKVTGLEKGANGLRVHLNQGQPLEVPLVVFATGVQPVTELAQAAGIRLGAKGAIKVNDRMQTSVDRIWAAGDCVEYHHRVLGEPAWIPLAPAANKSGRIAGTNAAGGEAHFPGILGTAVVKVFDLTVGVTGLTERQARGSGKFAQVETVTITAGDKAHYYPGAGKLTIKLTVDGRRKKLLGAQILGGESAAKRLDVFATALAAGFTVHDIAMLDLSYAPPYAPVYDPVNVAAGVADK